ncbi:MAG: hypothetical protein AB1861_01455 [Cyanobacteriota bacterium]
MPEREVSLAIALLLYHEIAPGSWVLTYPWLQIKEIAEPGKY